MIKKLIQFSGVYISESVHPNLRGSLVVLPNLFMSLGLLLIWTLAYFFSWNITAYLAMVAPVMLTFFMWFLPESPYWLVESNKFEEAK